MASNYTLMMLLFFFTDNNQASIGLVPLNPSAAKRCHSLSQGER